MLSALRTEDRRQVVLLRQNGLAAAEALRIEAREDRIVCEVCNQPVVVRAGAERIWHFAHRTRENCPKAEESLELIECRALLYSWLLARFPDSVQLEKVIPGLPRPVDCWVERPGKPPCAWWLVTAGLKPEVRDLLTLGFANREALPHYVFVARMLTRDPDHPNGFILGTTQRDLMETSSYGELYGGRKDSLHYLDPAPRHLITCRGLAPFHPPQDYRAVLLDHPLEEVRILPRTGEFVHPGEAERLKDLHEEARRMAVAEAERIEARRKAREAERAAAARLAAERAARPHLEKEDEERVESHVPCVSPPRPVPRVEGPVYTCRVCGRQTRDWVILYGQTGQCKCRDCAR